MSDERRPTVEVGDEVELAIDKLIAGGDGLARVQGLPVFVPRSAPGDRVRVRVSQRKADFARAEVLEVLEPGPHRRAAPCPHFTHCGGCDLQHIEDEAQVLYKVAATRETLERLGGLTWPQSARVVSGPMWGYRLRATFHLQPSAGASPAIGYMEVGSHRLVAIDTCPILRPELEAALRELPGRITGTPPRRLDVASGDDGSVTLAPPLAGSGGGPVQRRVGEWTFWYDARCFFQSHAGLLDDLVSAVVGPWEGELACDLFAGVGLFGPALAQRYRRVIAVEGDRIAVRYHRRNLRENRVANVEVAARAVESWISELPPGVDRVVVDPPRMGLGRAVRATLLARRPGRITYVSCHPAALARDLRELAAGYRVESLALLDLFPQTGHMEVVVQLVSDGG